MERYTIRILYRDRENPGRFVGVMETGGIPGKKGFIGLSVLWKVLLHAIDARAGSEPESPAGILAKGGGRIEEIFRLLREKDL